MSANLAQPTISREAAQEEVSSFVVDPATSERGFFSSHVMIRHGVLPWESTNPVNFFSLQVKLPTGCACPGIACTGTFHCEGTMFEHMKKECSNFHCTTCPNDSTHVYKKVCDLQKHKRRCKGLQHQRDYERFCHQRQAHLDFMNLFTCLECNKKFPSKTKLKRHLLDCHKGTSN
jgi:hypothetical protein